MVTECVRLHRSSCGVATPAATSSIRVGWPSMVRIILMRQKGSRSEAISYKAVTFRVNHGFADCKVGKIAAKRNVISPHSLGTALPLKRNMLRERGRKVVGNHGLAGLPLLILAGLLLTALVFAFLLRHLVALLT